MFEHTSNSQILYSQQFINIEFHTTMFKYHMPYRVVDSPLPLKPFSVSNRYGFTTVKKFQKKKI